MIAKHCCELMDDFLKDKRVPIFYEPVMREYYLLLKPPTALQLIYFCPWCSTKLPSNLSDIYFDILEKEYGIDAWDIHDVKTDPKIPLEFKSDEWWKKRGL